jgi:hypothetical protein
MTGIQETRLVASKTKKEWQVRCHGCRTPCRSAAASAPPKRVKNQTILGAQRSAGTAGWARWLLALDRSQHDRTTPARNHAGITSVRRNHTQHRITIHTTCAPHNDPPNHASTTSNQHDEHRHNGRSHSRQNHITKEPSHQAAQPPNALPFSCRERWYSLQKP